MRSPRTGGRGWVDRRCDERSGAGGAEAAGNARAVGQRSTASPPARSARTGAADAAVVHLKDLLLALHDERVVDAYLPILVLDHSNLLAVVLCGGGGEARGAAGSGLEDGSSSIEGRSSVGVCGGPEANGDRTEWHQVQARNVLDTTASLSLHRCGKGSLQRPRPVI